MSWFFVDDGFYDHPKLATLPRKRQLMAVGLWTLAGSWSRKKLTGGVVPRHQVEKLGGDQKTAQDLVDCGLWVSTEEGYEFHDWKDWQETPEEVEHKRELGKVRAKRWRDKRVSNGVTRGVTNAPRTHRERTAFRDPSPSPSPDPPSQGVTEREVQDCVIAAASGAATALEVRTRPGKPDRHPSSAVWEAYAEAYDARYNAKPIRNAKVNSQFAQLLRRLPGEEAPQVVRHYLRSSNARYVASGHSVGCLLQDAEKLRTEWATSTHGTAHQAREADRRSGRGAEYRQLFAELRAEDEEDARRALR